MHHTPSLRPLCCLQMCRTASALRTTLVLRTTSRVRTTTRRSFCGPGGRRRRRWSGGARSSRLKAQNQMPRIALPPPPLPMESQVSSDAAFADLDVTLRLTFAHTALSPKPQRFCFQIFNLLCHGIHGNNSRSNGFLYFTGSLSVLLSHRTVWCQWQIQRCAENWAQALKGGGGTLR